MSTSTVLTCCTCGTVQTVAPFPAAPGSVRDAICETCLGPRRPHTVGASPPAVSTPATSPAAAPTATAPRSYKVACWDRSGGEPAYNALRYPSHESARRAGADLASRWTGLARYEVHPSEDEPNQGEDGRAIPAPTPVTAAPQITAADPLAYTREPLATAGVLSPADRERVAARLSARGVKVSAPGLFSHVGITAAAAEEVQAESAAVPAPIRLPVSAITAIGDLWDAAQGADDTDYSSLPETVEDAALSSLVSAGLIETSPDASGHPAVYCFTRRGISLFVDFADSALLRAGAVEVVLPNAAAPVSDTAVENSVSPPLPSEGQAPTIPVSEEPVTTLAPVEESTTVSKTPSRTAAARKATQSATSAVAAPAAPAVETTAAPKKGKSKTPKAPKGPKKTPQTAPVPTAAALLRASEERAEKEAAAPVSGVTLADGTYLSGPVNVVVTPPAPAAKTPKQVEAEIRAVASMSGPALAAARKAQGATDATAVPPAKAAPKGRKGKGAAVPPPPVIPEYAVGTATVGKPLSLNGHPATAEKDPKRTAAAHKTAADVKAKAGAPKKNGLRKPQVNILRYLATQNVGRTRKEVSVGAPCDLAWCTEWIGSHDPVKRLANDAKCFPSLITLGYVEGALEDIAGKNVVLYTITESGREYLAALPTA